ncbi:IS21-like element helper ATPase IstB [Sporolactobacillus terrae]|uniref:IS21-like element helper ATPase IstB n=1 Tax=Sporolactobacillus terrae TaxID=269673 RepID=UPI00049183FB|nr:IS21-like element helper ATPase IstB [Sporolactobacillus terrae]
MITINPTKEAIKLYAKQLRTPSFTDYEAIIRQLDNEQSYEHFLRDLMRREVSQRQENQQKRRIKAAKFPYPKTLDEFDFSRLIHISPATVWELASCDFIKNRQNVVMIGNPGSGKTHTSIGIGMKACQAGFTVKFYTAAGLANELAEAHQYNRLAKFEKSLSKIDLLILDELSYLTFNRHQSEMLFQVISDRSERASIIVTTNLEFSRWTELFENEIMVMALIDRLTFRSHILDMNVDDSFRLLQTKNENVK